MTIIEAPDSRLRQISKPVEAVTGQVHRHHAGAFDDDARDDEPMADVAP